MNVSPLQSLPPQPVQRVASEAEDVSPDFLSIRLVNKRARVKLSPEPLNLSPLPSKGQLLAVANSAGWFAAVVNLSTGPALIASPVADLRSALVSGDGNAFQSQRTMSFASVVPHYIAFACNDTRFLVALTQGPVLVFDSAAFCQPGAGDVTPLHSFPSTTATAVRQMYPNPGDIPELVAILREPAGDPNGQLVEVLNVATLQSSGGWRGGGTSETFPTSLSWSPKGKQIAIGLQSGDIITFSPTDTSQAKSFVPKPPTAHNQAVIHTTWLSNPAFYTIFAPPGPLDPQVEQRHMIVSYESKRNSAADVTLPISFFPTGTRPPGAFVVALRNWDPAKILLLVGDSTTADIAIVGCVAKSPAEDQWQKLSLEDAATPSMPLDAESNETTMIGLELDLKNTQPFDHIMPSGESVEVPPPPIVYAYASDGTLTGWYIVNTRRTPYPGMLAGLAAAPAVTSEPISAPPPQPPAPAASPFPTAGPSAFGQTSAFGTPSSSAFGQSAFGQPSSFGTAAKSPFSQNTTPPFGQTATSPFGRPSSSTVAQPSSGSFGQSPQPVAGGFGAFASSGPSAFGKSAFSPTPASTSPPAPIEASQSTESMSTDGGFGGLSLGGGLDDKPKPGLGMTGMFGAAASQPAAQSPQPPSSSGAFGLSPGFGAFANLGQQQPKTEPVPGAAAPKAAAGFGQSGFGAAPAFGRSGFGQPSFGQPAFGSSGFGAGTPMSTTPQASPATANPPSSAFGSGGFGAYASSGLSTFTTAAKPAQDSAPAWKTAAEEKPQASAFGGGTGEGGFSSYASGGTSSFATAAKTQDAVPAWKTSGGSAFSGSGSSAFGTSPTPQATTPSTSDAGPSTPPAKPKSPLVPLSPQSPTSPPVSSAPAGPPPSTSQPSSSPFGTSKFGLLRNLNPKDSPFANPKPVTGVSAFSQPVNATPPKPATPGSVFGQTSTILPRQQPAFGQPAFGVPATPAAITTTAPTTTQTTTPPAASAFSAFSGATSAFGSSSVSTKSFGELLRESGEKAKAKEAPAPAFSVPRLPDSPFGKPKSALPKSAFEAPRSAFATMPAPTAVKTEDVSDDEEGGKGKGKAISKHSTQESVESLGSISTTSSFVEIPRPDEDEEAEGPLTPTSEEEEEEDGRDDIDDFLSDTYSDRGEEEEEEEGDSLEQVEEEEEEEEEEEVEEGEYEEEKTVDEDEETEVGEPTAGPLPSTPISRSPTATPKPSIKLELTSPPPSDAKKTRDQSTTPPGSPAKAPSRSPSPQPPLHQPAPTPASSSTSPSTLGLGLGRPSTRPLRSSPLASAPVSGGDEEDVKGALAKSPSPAPKPRPASPKAPFGQPVKLEISPAPSEKPLSPLASRPKTPPALFGKAVSPTAKTTPLVPPPVVAGSFHLEDTSPFPPPALSSTLSQPAASGSTSAFTPPGASSAFTLGGKPSPPASGPLSLGSFGFSKQPSPPSLGAKTPATPPATSSLFGTSTTPGSAPRTSSPLSTPPAGLYATPPPLGASPLGLFGKTTSTPSPAPAAPKSLWPLTTSAPQVPPQPPTNPMQQEFQRLFVMLAKELDNVGLVAHKALKQGERMHDPESAVASAVPNADPFTINGIRKLGRDIKATMSDLTYLAESRNEDEASIREFETGLLKAKTRKEEIVRFDKAKSDVEFAKMLKMRFLSPEHTELQTQLRRDIRAMNDRVTKMEDNLQAAKKKLNQVKTGKPGIKPPSLDTINRTARNIDIAIAQQAIDLNALTARVSRLDLDGGRNVREGTHARDKRLPTDVVRRPLNMTPHVASTIAAALNAEQSAHRLKTALLTARSTPLLNTQAARAPAPPKAFDAKDKKDAFAKPFELLPLNVSKSTPYSAGRRTPALHAKLHAKPVPFKLSAPSESKPQAKFDWGPLPGVPPKTTLAADLRISQLGGSS